MVGVSDLPHWVTCPTLVRMSNFDPISVEEAAVILRISPRAVRHRIKAGSIPAQKIGGGQTSAYVLNRSDVEAAAGAAITTP